MFAIQFVKEKKYLKEKNEKKTVMCYLLFYCLYILVLLIKNIFITICRMFFNNEILYKVSSLFLGSFYFVT